MNEYFPFDLPQPIREKAVLLALGLHRPSPDHENCYFAEQRPNTPTLINELDFAINNSLRSILGTLTHVRGEMLNPDRTGPPIELIRMLETIEAAFQYEISRLEKLSMWGNLTLCHDPIVRRRVFETPDPTSACDADATVQ